MVGSPLAAFTNSTERLIARKSYIDYCVILDIDKDNTDGVKCHSPDHPEYYNTVSIKIRSTKKNSTNPNVIQHVNALILQHYLGNCFGEPYNPRVGDLVAVLFMYNEKPLILGPIASIQQPPVMRAPTSEDAKYDHVNKWCQWLKPKKDKNYDFFDHPQGKMPVCFKRFHGPVTGSTGIGRDEMTVWDCQKGDADPTCSDCCNIDSVPRSGEQWHKIYSTQTESEEAYNSRMELHARCGSYFRIESDNTNEASSSSSEYSEDIGHIRLGNALTESDKRFHLNVQGNRYGDNGVGSFDLHTNHEEVQIASESTGVRFAAIRPEDSQVTWAYELMNFPTTSFIRCYKDGVIEINSLDGNSSITVDGTSNKVTVDGTVNVELIASSEVTCTTPLTHVTGNMQIDGTCTHGSCSCTAATIANVDLATGRIMKQEGNNQVPIGSITCTKLACYNSSKMACCTAGNDLYELVNGEWMMVAENVFDLCYSPNGLLCIIDTPANNAYRREADGETWTPLAGICTSIAAASDTVTYVIGADTYLWKNDAGSWTNPENSTGIIDVAISNDGDIYAIRQSDKALVKFNGTSFDVVSTDLAVKEISARDAYHILGLGNADDMVYLWNDVNWTSQGVTATSVALSIVG